MRLNATRGIEDGHLTRARRNPSGENAQQVSKPPAPKPGVPPDDVPPVPDPVPSPIENPSTDPDVIEPGEARAPM